MRSDREPPPVRPARSPLRVWDLPTRVFHWVLVALLAAAWYTAEEGPIEWHARIGQALLALIIYRVVWGIVGSETARFRHFVKGPKAVLGYGKGLFSRRTSPAVGHNPLGGLMVLVLLGLVATQATLGLFANDDIYFDGPLRHLVSKDMSDTLTGLHGQVFDLILVATAIHLAAALFYLAVKRENLIRPMITGRKRLPEPHPRLRFAPAWLALPVLAVAAALVWAAVNYL